MRAGAALLAAAALLACAARAGAAPTLVPVGAFDAPLYATTPPRDTERLFVAEQEGLVKVVHNGVVQPDPFIDLRDTVLVGSERGLLSLAFPPDYATTGLVYTYLTGPGGELQIREHRRAAGDANRTEPGSRLVWSQAHAAGNHNGGQIEFGPDGLLWLAPGDNAVAGNAQDLGNQLGKLLRIDPRPSGGREYTVPPDNPYAGRAGTAPEIWAAGLRNPYRFSFDRGTGDLLIGDVGAGAREEIDHVKRADGLARGANFGWPCFEGRATGSGCAPISPYVPPVFDYSTGSPKAVTGGYVVRDPGLPTLAGRYVYADVYDGMVRSFSLDGPDATDAPAGLPARPPLVAFGEDACGHVYVVSQAGTVDRIQDGAPGACVLKPAPGTAQPPAVTPPPPPPPSPAADTRAPALRVTVSGRRSALARRRLRVAVRSDEAAAVTVAGRLRGVAALRSARAQVPAGARRVVTMRLSSATARKLRRALRRRGRVVAVVTVRARDAAGNEARPTRRVTIRRR